VQVLILVITWDVPDLGSCLRSHRSVRRVFSSICPFPQDGYDGARRDRG